MEQQTKVPVQMGQAGQEADKTYYHRTPGAKFYCQIGSEAKEVAFAGGVLKLSSIPPAYRAKVREELDKIANIPTSHIYTVKDVVEPGEVAAAVELRQTAEQQFDTDRGITGNPVTVPIPVSKQSPPELPASLAAAQAAIAASGKVPPK